MKCRDKPRVRGWHPSMTPLLRQTRLSCSRPSEESELSECNKLLTANRLGTRFLPGAVSSSLHQSTGSREQSTLRNASLRSHRSLRLPQRSFSNVKAGKWPVGGLSDIVPLPALLDSFTFVLLQALVEVGA